MKVAGMNSKGLSQVCNNINKIQNSLHFLEFILISGAQPPFCLLQEIYSSHFHVKQVLFCVFSGFLTPSFWGRVKGMRRQTQETFRLTFSTPRQSLFMRSLILLFSTQVWDRHWEQRLSTQNPPSEMFPYSDGEDLGSSLSQMTPVFRTRRLWEISDTIHTTLAHDTRWIVSSKHPNVGHVTIFTWHVLLHDGSRRGGKGEFLPSFTVCCLPVLLHQNNFLCVSSLNKRIGGVLPQASS